MGVVHEPQEAECKVACPNVGVFWHSVCDTLQGASASQKGSTADVEAVW